MSQIDHLGPYFGYWGSLFHPNLGPYLKNVTKRRKKCVTRGEIALKASEKLRTTLWQEQNHMFWQIVKRMMMMATLLNLSLMIDWRPGLQLTNKDSTLFSARNDYHKKDLKHNDHHEKENNGPAGEIQNQPNTATLSTFKMIVIHLPR